MIWLLVKFEWPESKKAVVLRNKSVHKKIAVSIQISKILCLNAPCTFVLKNYTALLAKLQELMFSPIHYCILDTKKILGRGLEIIFKSDVTNGNFPAPRLNC